MTVPTQEQRIIDKTIAEVRRMGGALVKEVTVEGISGRYGAAGGDYVIVRYKYERADGRIETNSRIAHVTGPNAE